MALDRNLGELATGKSVEDAIASYLASLQQPTPADAAEDAARTQSEAVVEIMFLLAAVDGEVAPLELDLLRKNVRELSDVAVLTGVDADALVPALASRLAAEDWATRMSAARTTLVAPEVQRLAYRLAVGVAFVDDHVEAAEAEALEGLAKAFAIDGDEAHAIHLDVENTLFG